MKEEKIFRRKYGVDTLTDPATVNFACVGSSGQSKKDSAIEVYKLIVLFFFFSLYCIVQFDIDFLKFVLMKRKFA